MPPGRKLQLLLLNDQVDIGIDTDDIEVVPCPSVDGHEIQRLANWPQHMRLWGTDQVPDFDLLLIDIKFEHDTYDPPYFEEEAKIALGHPVPPNPFGLLHALPLVARQALTNMPFVWGVHSGNAGAIKNDPVAIWAFGLLCAMERRPGWDAYNLRSMPAYFSQQIDALPSLAPAQAWRDLIPRYRARLLDACKGRVWIDMQQLQNLIAQAEAISTAGENTAALLASLAKDSLYVYAGYEPHALWLRSLFAEVEPWEPRTVAAEVRGYLHKLKDACAAHIDIFPQVCEIITHLAQSGNAKPPLTQLLPKTNRAWVGVGVIVCLWLKRLFANKRRTSWPLVLDMGFAKADGRENYHAPTRLLQKAGFPTTLGEFLKGLETTPLPPVWRECGRRYAMEVLDWNRHQEAHPSAKWPRCLGEEM